MYDRPDTQRTRLKSGQNRIRGQVRLRRFAGRKTRLGETKNPEELSFIVF
jgi:hypothetical protein